MIAQSLVLATDVLAGQDSPSHAAEVESEFLAYWTEFGSSDVLSICPPCNPVGPIYVGRVKNDGEFLLIAPSKAEAVQWATAVGGTASDECGAFFFQLDSVPTPPAFDASLSLRQSLDLLAAHAPHNNMQVLRNWLKNTRLPVWIVVCARRAAGGEIIFGVYMPALPKSAIPTGFRKGHVPPALVAKRSMGESVQRVRVSRMDPSYVVARGGGDTSLQERTVTVAGCGSVGSHVALSLAASGIGTLRLIDPDTLVSDNVHRHVLGAAHLREHKVDGIAEVIHGRLPHISVTPYSQTIESVLVDDAEDILSSDVVVIAIGNETIERRLNEFLIGKARRLHVWVEPLGIGGHLLSLPADGPGCLHCLYHLDDDAGLANTASLVAPGQSFQRTLSGCAGTFTPYGALDAGQAAIHASREVIAILQNKRTQASLVSWVVSKQLLVSEGFSLSTRGAQMDEGAIRRESDFARADCPVCGTRYE